MKLKYTFLPLILLFVVFGLTTLGYFLPSGNKLSPEISLNSFSTLGKMYGSVTAASCGFADAGHADADYTACNQVICTRGSGDTGTTFTLTAPGRSLCGGACQPIDPNICTSHCANGASNFPTCDQCPANSSFFQGQCLCSNRATSLSNCQVCPTGLSMVNGICQCSNGATNPMQCNICPSGTSMQAGQCVCANGGDPLSNCTSCPAGKVQNSSGQCVPGCELTNVCGQKVTGVLDAAGKCSAPDGGNVNNSCILDFRFNTDTINPNGSVEFSWKIKDVPGVGRKCGFVDLTTPTPRPIPGLQNLDPSVDRIRINNIQITTRFCLVCQFYNLLNNSSLGDAAIHQWIRVIKIGEN